MKPTPPPRAIPGRHVYDVIVLGGHLAGAFTAAVLARRGIKVLLVPHDGLGAPYLHQGFALPHLPFVMPPAKAVEAFEELTAEVGLTVSVHRALSHPAMQLLSPGRWFELKSDPKERAVELKRALGPEAAEFDRSLKATIAAAEASDALIRARLDLPPEGTLARWRLGRQLPRFPGLDQRCPLPSGSLLRALSPLAAPVAVPTGVSETRPLGRLLSGPSVFPGGRERLYHLFAEKARELGADVVGPEERVEELEVHGSTVASLRFKGLEVAYRAELFVAAMDLDALAHLATPGRAGPLTRAAGQLKVSRQLFTVNAVLPEGALPPGLGTLAVVQAASGVNVLLQVSPARGPATEGEKSMLSVLTAAKETTRPLKTGDAAGIRAELDATWAALDDVLPFTRAKARLESTPWLHAPGQLEGRGDASALFELPADSWFGVTGVTTQGPLKRLLIASRQVLPGLGLEGEVLAAQRAVARVERALKRNDPLKARKSA